MFISSQKVKKLIFCILCASAVINILFWIKIKLKCQQLQKELVIPNINATHATIDFQVSDLHIVTQYTSLDIPHLKENYTWPLFTCADKVLIRKFDWVVEKDTTQCKLSHLGQQIVPLSIQDLEHPLIRPFYQQPKSGGVWSPRDCTPIDRVVILVPYRRRRDNLQIFIAYMHGFLQKQGLDYGIYIIEQTDQKRFNRAKLFNIGFLLTQLMHNYSCYVLHDIDKLPEDTNFIYRCQDKPVHMLNDVRYTKINDTAVDQISTNDKNAAIHYKTGHLYRGYFGGVSALRQEHYLAINGMVNNYWGWGAEDDELFNRLAIKQLMPRLTRDRSARYVVLYHRPDAEFNHRSEPNRKNVSREMKTNGLNSVDFKLDDIRYYPLYTLIRTRL